MSKKKKKYEGKKNVEQTVKEQENLEEETLQKEEQAEEQAETEAKQEQEESQEEVQAQDPQPAPEEKKERKLKWAKPNPLEEKLAEATDKYARLFAEFDNFRKRSEKEKSQRYDFGAKDMVEKILPVIDNFERGLAAVSAEQAEDSFVKGMEMTYKQLMKVLEDAGVKPIEALGQEFNPDFHNAVMHVDDPEAGENVIVEEFQKGYMYKDHVIRYSMVKVAN